MRLPPLVGYLVAGFVLQRSGTRPPRRSRSSRTSALLLLFGIGLKLRLRTLERPVVWAGASVHVAATTAVIGALFLGVGALGPAAGVGLSPADPCVLVGFAFSFSSTVFAVKALEERNESASLQGRIARRHPDRPGHLRRGVPDVSRWTHRRRSGPFPS